MYICVSEANSCKFVYYKEDWAVKGNIKIISVLTLTCIVCAFLLAFVNSLAKEKIAENDKKKTEDAIFKLVPSAKKVESLNLEGETVYKLFDESNQEAGYAFLAKGDGYQGAIKMIAVIDPAFAKLGGIEVIESVETPGLGAKINDDFFKDQFKNLNVTGKIECLKEEVKNDNQIKAISSATISSKAVVNILNKKVEEIRAKLKK